MSDTKFTLLTVSSLDKIFPDEPFQPQTPCTGAAMFLNERFSFQAAYCLEGPQILHANVALSGSLKDEVVFRQTGLVPSELPIFPEADDFLLRTTPGLYPDPLYPVKEPLTLIPGQWRGLWFTVPAECTLPAGSYDLTITFTCDDGAVLGSCTFTVERLDACLPEQTLLHTEWFHTDCIADWYKTPVFSEEYWTLVEKYMKEAAKYGINMLLTPLFTPPLDTAPGGERTTVQLIDVSLSDGTYTFNFEKLERWLSLCERSGIRYMEFSHLFTQWGAGHAPKIMAKVANTGEGMQGKETVKQIFGWATDAASDEYREFLEAFLPGLMEFIEGISCAGAAISMFQTSPPGSIFPPTCMRKSFWSPRLTAFPLWMRCRTMNFMPRGWWVFLYAVITILNHFWRIRFPAFGPTIAAGSIRRCPTASSVCRHRETGFSVSSFINSVSGAFCSGALISGMLRFPATALILTALPTLPAHFLPAMPSLFIRARTARWLPYGLRC